MSQGIPPPDSSMLSRQLAIACTLLVAASSLSAQAAPRTLRGTVPGFVETFHGKWKCDGNFSNGKAISATMSFDETLNGAWLSASHDDLPPNGYHALGLWTAPAAGGIVAHIADNGGGMRKFTAADGWKNDRLVLERDTVRATPQRSFRF